MTSVSFTRHPGRVIMAMLATILATYGISAAQAENPADRADRVDNRVYKEWPLIVTADHADGCGQALALGQQAQQDGGLAATFSLLNWNVEKAKDPSLVREFAELARLSDLIFLQEAVPLKKTQTVIEQSLFEAFVRGYVQNEVETGVLTLARTPHLVHCQLLATEPWLRTPKATSVTLYPLADSNDTLLTVNLHAVNFSFGVKAYQGQLDKAAELIRGHEGPVIFGGDLGLE